MTLNGLDISSETQNISYKDIKKNNIKFVMIRAGFTDYDKNKTKNIDSKFEYNYSLAKLYKLDIGVYYTSRAVSLDEAKEEIEYFLSIIKDKEFEYPVCIQIEDDHNTIIYYQINQKTINKKEFLDITSYMIDKIKISGYKPLVRTYYDWYIDIYNKSDKYLYWLDDGKDKEYITSNIEDNKIYLNKDEDKVEVVLINNCILSKIKNNIKIGYKIVKSKIRRK